MSIPDFIEIVPLAGPVTAEVTVPGSKSLTNRALILAALARGESRLQGALWSEDTQVMVASLRQLEFAVDIRPESSDLSNRTITVAGQGGNVPRSGGTVDNPLDIFVGNAGTAARFLAALACLGRGVYRFHGVPRMHERPQAALFAALRQLGYRVDSPNDKLPALIHGGGARPGACVVSIEESSQFASALLLCSGVAGWRVQVSGENAEESPYVKMTEGLRSLFPAQGGSFQVEPDASSGSYFWAIDALLKLKHAQSRVVVAQWPSTDLQVDARFPRFAREQGQRVISRTTDLGDSIMTAIVMAPFWREPTRFTDLGRLRLQECERVAALRLELGKCGARVVEEGDSLTVFPSELRGAEIETYNDHRMAMCFAVLGLVIPGIRLRGASCVKKTFPNFFQKLALKPPVGLGATIRHAGTGQVLREEELVAGEDSVAGSSTSL